VTSSGTPRRRRKSGTTSSAGTSERDAPDRIAQRERAMEITFHGAAGGVTGSCHLVTCGGRRILVDCGMFQGGRELHEENADDFGFDPADIDVLLLTHAHLDHCGRIPLLVKRGFRGEIICTSATRDLTRLVLLDSAHLHEEEAKRRNRHRHGGRGEGTALRHGRCARQPRPVRARGGIRPARASLGRRARHVPRRGPHPRLGQHPAGTGRERAHRRILFSGDIGPENRPLLNAPRRPRPSTSW
jgi:metallo-beta-lactamase family protein